LSRTGSACSRRCSLATVTVSSIRPTCRFVHLDKRRGAPGDRSRRVRRRGIHPPGTDVSPRSAATTARLVKPTPVLPASPPPSLAAFRHLFCVRPGTARPPAILNVDPPLARCRRFQLLRSSRADKILLTRCALSSRLLRISLKDVNASGGYIQRREDNHQVQNILGLHTEYSSAAELS